MIIIPGTELFEYPVIYPELAVAVQVKVVPGRSAIMGMLIVVPEQTEELEALVIVGRGRTVTL